MASSSSSQVPQIKYDVFINFRGSDIRHGFLSHLKKELHHKQIDAYVDERLERGDEISSALLEAIEGSLISLIIFSKDYASSKWCLEELVKIIECKEVNELIVIPVFYDTDPSDVRHQKGTYGDAFAQHEQMFKDNMEKVQNWRSALNKAVNFSGYHHSSNFENESELIDKIVQDVLEKLDGIYPIEPTKGLVGIDRNFACIESLLEIESEEVRILGIWGMGGIGKTTVAHAICDKFFFQYESCCFLENVREESKKTNGLSYLFQKLLSQLLEQENLHAIDTLKARSNMVIKRRLCRKKVLIVLDDVDTSEQLEYLVGEQLCLGRGSRVIVTSRDKHILICRGVHAIHEVKALNFQESLKLFSLSVFNQSHPKIGYEELSKRAVVYASGIPLALKVLGSNFHSRNIETWESALQKLEKYPNVQIQNVLKVSYDGLDGVEKDIFLDIAFFFKGEFKDDVIRVLDACGFYASSGIDRLLDKTLITISNNNRIQMHDLIQEMGEQIVREESIKDPGRRSRLRDIEEIYDVLKSNKETDAVEGIILDVSQIRDVLLSADTFKKMCNLRFLKFYSNWYKKSYNVNLPFGFESFSDKLRYFQWDAYPLESMPLAFCPENLVEFHMKDSHVKKLWEGVQDLVNLKTIILRGSRHLLELPDFSKAQNLECVGLSYCRSLCNVHPSILSLQSLRTMDLNGCKKLKSLQSEKHLKSLMDLEVKHCSSLQEFSFSSEKVTYLNLETTGIEILHSSIGRSIKLKRLYLNGSTLKTLPINGLSYLRSLEELGISKCGQLVDEPKLHILFDALRSLRYLNLEGCSTLSKLPDNISALSSLCVLGLEGSSIESLPGSIKHLSNLEKIYLSNCRMLRFVPQLPPFITHLDADNCTSLEIVLTSTTSTLQQDIEKKYVFSFKNCMKLDEHSLIVEFAQFSMKQAVYNNPLSVRVCYPGNRVPEWFGYRQTETTITIELVPPFDDMKGFVFCSALSQFFPMQLVRGYSLDCQCYFEYGEEIEAPTVWTYYFTDLKLNSDHVFLWYGPFDYEDILEEVKRRGGNDEVTTYSPKLSFKFSVVSSPVFDKPLNHDDLIKACGVCPIYASENRNFLQQMELEMKTKSCGDIDEQRQLPSAKRLKEYLMV